MQFKSFSKLHLVCLIAAILILQSCTSWRKASNGEGERTSQEFCHVLFYNVENLFDTIDDPRKNDKDFLPEGSYHWNSYKYFKKLNSLSKVILASTEWEMPDIIGLCEIENRRVLEDLLYFTPLKSANYKIIHKESPDRRGIDVGLYYNEKKFKPLYYEFMNIRFPFDTFTRTREILYCNGIVDKTDTLHIFVNHWPSRRGGKEKSEVKRVFVASVLKAKVDSLFRQNPERNVLIMGDFNDEPMDKSITEALGATYDTMDHTPEGLFNLTYQFKARGEGSYKYKYEWNQLDQFIVSSHMLTQNPLQVKMTDVKIVRYDWMLMEDTKYTGSKPFRTNLGPRYLGGYSDHLPIYVKIGYYK
jgi:hypothetical protein